MTPRGIVAAIFVVGALAAGLVVWTSTRDDGHATVVSAEEPTATPTPLIVLPTLPLPSLTPLPTIELPSVTPLPTLPLPTITPLPTLELPSITPLPTIDLPSITPLPTLDLPTITVTVELPLPSITPLPTLPLPTITPIVCLLDLDCDGVEDLSDNCILTSNADQANNDRNDIDLNPQFVQHDLTWPNSDAMGDACDDDDDNDGLADADELSGDGCSGVPTDAFLRDTDSDRALDGAECALGADPLNSGSRPAFGACGMAGDLDLDGISNRIEYCYYNSNMLLLETDLDFLLDGARDGCEVASLNTDRIVNSLDQGMLASGIAEMVTYTAGIDLNKDGVLNSIDQGLMASFIVPSGQCP